MGLFDKVEKTKKDYMLIVYVRHFGEILRIYMKNPTIEQFLRDKDAKETFRYIYEPIPAYMEDFARDIGTGVVWDANEMLFYLPPAWYDVRNHASNYKPWNMTDVFREAALSGESGIFSNGFTTYIGGNPLITFDADDPIDDFSSEPLHYHDFNDYEIDANAKIDGKSIPDTFKKYIIEHVNEKMLSQVSLTEKEKSRFLKECGGRELKEVFAKRFMGYPCEKTLSIYFFALFPNIRNAALLD